ncbi:hypothetical protein ACP70R_038299 [Stipagrostis hirtigluma subsp. patula]
MAIKIKGYFDDDTMLVSFHGDHITTTVTDSGDVVRSWVEETYRAHRRCPHRLVVGLDAKWRTSARHPGPVAVLQLCVGRRCLVFQILCADRTPGALLDFAADRRRFTFVGVGIFDVTAKLRDEYGLRVGRAVDLRGLAADMLGRVELWSAGLRELAWEVIGVEMEKPRQLRGKEWEERVLTDDQLKHACADAFAAMEVGWRLYDDDERRG